MESHLPYPGLRPFFRHEADIFFGREAQTDELLQKLAHSHFVAVVGPSGCGKSSLVRAGLIASLETGLVTSAGSRWRIATMRPGNQPMRALAEALLEDSALGPERAGAPDAAQFLAATLWRGPLGLLEALQETPIEEGANLLLLVDQFEEIFRYRDRGDPDEAHAFVALLLETARRTDIPVYVVMTMRSDFLGDCALFNGLPEAMNESQYLTPRPTREQRRAAIVGPARVFGGDVDPALVNRLLNETGEDPDQLPLLQHLLMRMWTRTRSAGELSANRELLGRPAPALGVEEADTGVYLTMDDYERAGGLFNALSRHADEAWSALDEEQQRIAEVLFRNLCERGPKDRDTRRPVRVDEVAEVAGVGVGAAIEVIDAFRDPHSSFILPAPPAGLEPETIVDISHESLIRLWDRLNEWVRRESESAETYLLLEQNARLWSEGKAALWGSPNLERALDWRRREQPTEQWAARYGEHFELAMQFLKESRRKQKADLVARRRARIRQRALWAGTALLVVTSSLASWALWERSKAQENLRETRAREIAYASLENLRRDPERSLLLALHAASIDTGSETPGREVEDALRRSQHLSRLRYRFESPDAKVTAIAFSPDGRRIATAGNDGTGGIRDTESAEHLGIDIGHEAGSAILDVAYSADGAKLATADVAGVAMVRGIADDGTLSGPPVILGGGEDGEGHEGGINGIAVSPDGATVATAGADGTVAFWNAADGALLAQQPAHEGRANTVVFSADGATLASGGEDGTVVVWDTVTHERLETVARDAAPSEVVSVALSRDGSRLAAGHAGNLTVLWSTDSYEVVDVFGEHNAEVNDVAFSPDGRTLATASADRTVKLWSTGAGKLVNTLYGHRKQVWDVEFSRNGEYIASADAGGTLILWDSGAATGAASFRGHENWVFGVDYDPNRQRIVSSSMDGSVRVWDPITLEEVVAMGGREAAPLEQAQTVSRAVQAADAGGSALAHDDGVVSAVFDATGTRIASASVDGTVKVWDAGTGVLLARYPRAENETFAPMYDVAFDHDGRWLAAVGMEPAPVLVIDLETHAVERIGAGEGDGSGAHAGIVTGVAFSPDGLKLATSSMDGTAILWDAASSAVEHRLEGHGDAVWDVTFSPDGRRLATASYDRTAIVWDVESGESLATLRGHQAPVWSAAFSADGERIATASSDLTAKIWDARSGDELKSLPGHTLGVWNVAFVDDGRRLVTTSLDYTAQVHELSVQKLLHTVRRRVTRAFTGYECRRYLGASGGGCPETAVSLIMAGRNAIENGDVESGIARYRAARSMFPVLRDGEAEYRWAADDLLKVARRAARRLDVDTTIRLLRRANDVGGGLELGAPVEAIRREWLNEANRLLALGDTTKSAALADGILDLPVAPASAGTLVALGDIYRIAGEGDRAVELYRRAQEAEADPESRVHVNASIGIANQAIAQSDFDRAARLVRAVLEAQPDNDYARVTLADVMLRRGEIAGSIEILESVRESSPDYLYAEVALADAYRQAGRIDRSLQQTENVLERHPDYDYALFVLGQGRLAGGDTDGAIEAFSRIGEHQQMYADAVSAIGAIHYDHLHDVDAAHRIFEQAHEAFPDHEGIAANLAEVLLAAGRYDRAASLARERVEFYRRAETPNRDAETALRIIEFSALLLARRRGDAARRLEELIERYNADYESRRERTAASGAPGWSYSGTRHVIEGDPDIAREDKRVIVRLIELVEKNDAPLPRSEFSSTLEQLPARASASY